MKAQKYCCNHCGEIFGIEKASPTLKLTCPRCYSEDLLEYNACSLEIGPPPWEYQCLKCRVRFMVASPRGPDEAEAIICPACLSKDVKWLSLATSDCASGG